MKKNNTSLKFVAINPYFIILVIYLTMIQYVSTNIRKTSKKLTLKQFAKILNDPEKQQSQ